MAFKLMIFEDPEKRKEVIEIQYFSRKEKLTFWDGGKRVLYYWKGGKRTILPSNIVLGNT